MTQIYRPEDEPDELCSWCGHRERAHVPAPIGTCTVSEVTEGSLIGCMCKEYLACSPEPVQLWQDTEEGPVSVVLDQCHAVLWVEPGRRADLLVTAQRPVATRWALRCRFVSGHEDPFHEHYDGTRWMIQTEDR